MLAALAIISVIQSCRSLSSPVLARSAPGTCGVGGVLGGDGGISGGEGGVTSGGVNVFVNVVTVPSADFP